METTWLVRINVAWNIVEITSDERDALLKKIAVVAGYEPIVEKFIAVGASGRPVELDAGERSRMRVALEFWQRIRELPEGLERLLDALVQAAPTKS